jgi:hypothetical protein
MSISGGEAAVIAGIVGGGSAILAAGLAAVATYKVTDRQVKSAVAVSEAQRAHELRMAKDERQQARRAEAYLLVVAFMDTSDRWTSWGYFDLLNPGSLAQPTLPEPDDQLRARQAATLFLSDEARDLFDRYMDASLEFMRIRRICDSDRSEGAVSNLRISYEAIQSASKVMIDRLRAELDA